MGDFERTWGLHRALNRSFRCDFRANGALFSSVTHCYRKKYKLAFKPEKGLKFQYFPVVSRREGILECPFLCSARSSSFAISIFGASISKMLPFVKDITQGGAAVIAGQGMDESLVREARLKPRQGGAKGRQDRRNDDSAILCVSASLR